MTEISLPFITRLWLCLVCLVRVLVDGAFAARVWAVRHGKALPPDRSRPAPRAQLPEDDPAAGRGQAKKRRADAERQARARREASEKSRIAPLQLLALLQREGRFIDFLQQDITSFDDGEVGAAARVVHEGCRSALKAHASIVPIRDEEEDSSVAIDEGFNPSEIKLSGKVAGKPPYRGTLRHRGWRVTKLSLPTPLEGHDFEVVAPAEVEL